jgi:hypothetical protein
VCLGGGATEWDSSVKFANWHLRKGIRLLETTSWHFLIFFPLTSGGKGYYFLPGVYASAPKGLRGAMS